MIPFLPAAGKLSSSGSDSEQEDTYYETEVQGSTMVSQLNVDENAQDFGYGTSAAPAPPQQYDDQGEGSFDPTEFFNSFAKNQQVSQDSNPAGDPSQARPENINQDLILSESGSDSDEGQPQGAEYSFKYFQ